MVDDGLSTRQIASKLGCSQTTVKYWVNKHGLNGRLAYNKARSKASTGVCSKCQRRYVYRKSAGHTKARCNGCVVYERKVRIKKRLIEHLGGKCSRCGYDKHHAALQFHHHGKKDFGIARNYNRRFEVLLAEVEKCELVCACCHLVIHARDV